MVNSLDGQRCLAFCHNSAADDNPTERVHTQLTTQRIQSINCSSILTLLLLLLIITTSFLHSLNNELLLFSVRLSRNQTHIFITIKN